MLTIDIYCALASQIKKRRYELTDAMKMLTEENQLVAHSVREKKWFDLDTDEDIAKAQQYLRIEERK